MECKGARGVCLVWVLGVYEEVLWIWKIMGMAPPTWDILANIEDAKEISDYNYRKVYPTSAVAPKLYSLPKIHKVGTPLRTIVSSRRSLTCGVAKALANIIHPLVGQSPYNPKNTQHFVQNIKEIKLDQGRS